jgi:tetratricopeptide (TPR) repeat protein
VAVDPSYAKAYSRLGLAYYHLGRYEEAITEG